MQKVFIKHICHLCEKAFTSLGNLRKHLKNAHDLKVEIKIHGKKRKQLENDINYELVDKEELADVARYTCAVCDNIFTSLLETRSHFQLQHIHDDHADNEEVDVICNKTSKAAHVTEEAEVVVSTNMENPFLEPGSPSVRVSKRKYDNSLTDIRDSQPFSMTQSQSPQSSTLKFSIKGKEVAILSATENLHSPHKPKITKIEVAKLEKLVLLGLSGVVSKGLEDEVTRNRDCCRHLSSLHSIPSAFEFLTKILDLATPSDALSAVYHNDFKPDLSTHQGQFLAVIQATLADFCGMTLTNEGFMYLHNHERTFWAECIIPMFKYFSRITNLVQFKWCETPTKSRPIATMLLDTLECPTARYVDGLGESIYGENIVMEASSGAIAEDVAHTNGDTLKLMQSAIEMLRVQQMNNLDANCHTFAERTVLSIQTVKNKITLSGVSLADNNKYKIVELRSGTIPCTWSGRHNWFRVFELLAHIMEVIIKQQHVESKLTKEKNGLIYVDQQDTVSAHLGQHGILKQQTNLEG